jgi:regulator of sirC expression with transglutaminase-like and TPR domain
MTRRAVRPPSPRWFWAFVLCVVIGGAFAWARTVHRKQPLSYVDRLSTLSEDQIDVARIALELSKSFHPDLNVRYYLWRVDEMAKRVAQVAGGTEDPEERIQALNTVFFKERGFGYDFQSLKEERPGARYLERLIDSRRGTCYTMPMLYMAIAHRLGYPIYPVLAPGHCFLRYVVSDLRYINIEVTTGGHEYPDSDYEKHLGISREALGTTGTHLAN